MDGVVVVGRKELAKYRHGINVLEKRLSIAEFAVLNEKSYRQAQRIIKKLKLLNELSMVHGNIGRSPVNKTAVDKIDEILDLYKSAYSDHNLTHFLECLEEKEGLKIPYSTLYRYSKKQGLIKNPKRRSKKKFSTRARLPREGMLIQFDGSEHRWFGDSVTDLIAGIDDATGRIIAAEFVHGESSLNSMKVIKQIILENGIPEAFYMDEAAIFGKRDRDWNSQIGRALEVLGSKLILASSPQAKGRIERLFRTLQDRLIAELNFAQITEMRDANEYLKKIFIPKFNEKFGVLARELEKSYRPFVGTIDLILCRKVERKVTSGNTFSWNNTTYVIQGNKDYRFRTVHINTLIDGNIKFDIMGKEIEVSVFEKPERSTG